MVNQLTPEVEFSKKSESFSNSDILKNQQLLAIESHINELFELKYKQSLNDTVTSIDFKLFYLIRDKRKEQKSKPSKK